MSIRIDCDECRGVGMTGPDRRCGVCHGLGYLLELTEAEEAYLEDREAARRKGER